MEDDGIVLTDNQTLTTTVGTTTTTTSEQTTRQSGKRNKLIAAVILIILITLIIIDSFTNQYVKDGIFNFLQWVENHPTAGVFAFTIVYFVCTVLFIPGSVLTLGAGFVFADAFGLGMGVLLATLSVFVGASAGAMTDFLLARYLFQTWVQTLIIKYPIFEAIDTVLDDKGFRIMTLLRLSPIVPFNALNYISGITSISFGSYSLALVAILPGTIFYVFLGASAGSLADSGVSGDNSTVKIVTIVVGLIFGVLAIAVTSYYAKIELHKTIKKKNESESNQGEVNFESLV